MTTDSSNGFLIGKKTFVIVWGEGLIVKAAAADYERLRREPGVTPFAPGGERPMSSWLVVEGGAVADDPELVECVRSINQAAPARTSAYWPAYQALEGATVLAPRLVP